MDPNMPNTNGWEAAEHLESRPKYEHIHMVDLTSRALESGREKAFDTGCDELGARPLDIDRLIR